MAEPKTFFRHTVRLPHTLAIVSFPLLGLLLYGHTLEVPFYLDDFINIRDKLYAMKVLSFGELVKASFEGFASRRPLANLSFALNYYFHGLSLPGYHLVNMGIHVMNGALLYLFIFKTLTLPGQRRPCPYPGWVALFSSLLWFVNPVQTQAVTYIVQRMTSMSALFFLSSLVLFVYGRLSQKGLRRAILFFGSALCGACSAATKEIAFVLPVLVYIYEWLFFQDLSGKWLKRSIPFVLGAVAVLLVAIHYLYHYTPLSILTRVFQPRTFTVLERLLTESRVIFFYMGLVGWPHPERLNLNHDISASRGLFDPISTVVAIAGLSVLLVTTVVLVKRHRIMAFALIWFFLNVALEAVAAEIEFIFEHRIYLPSMLLFLPVVWLLFHIKKPFVASAAISAAIVVFSLWTHQRNALWGEPISFWQDAVAKSPNHYRSYSNLGISCLDAKVYTQAQEALEKALTLDPPYPTEIYVNLGLLHLEKGEIDKAQENLDRALALNRHNYVALDLLGTVARKQGKPEEAIKWHEEALRVNPDFSTAHYNLGTLYKDMGQRQKAVQALHRALAVRPMWAKAHSALGLMYAEQRDYARAELSLSKSVHIDPSNTEALFNLAKVYELTARPTLAAQTYLAILEIEPEDIEALHNLGIIYVKDLRDPEKARRCLAKALRLDPEYDQAVVARKILSQIGGRP